MNVNYIGDVTLAHSFSDSIVQSSYGIADCSKMRGGSSEGYNSFRPICIVVLLSLGCTSKSGNIKLTK